MRQKLISYFLWILLPSVVSLGLGHGAVQRARDLRNLESGQRFGHLTAAFLRNQMGIQATELAREAPTLTNPDPTSPILRAALEGDTVAALGVISGELVLSVALGEEGMDPSGVRVRAITRPFPSQFLTRLTGSVGYPVALYLRGRRSAGEPQGFGPDTLGANQRIRSGSESTNLNTPGGPAVLLPVDDDPSSSTPIHLLVAPSLPNPSTPLLWEGSGILCWGAVIGLLALFFYWRKPDLGVGFPHRLLLLLVFGAPLASLWIGLYGQGRGVASERFHFHRGEMVRTLAVLKDGGDRLDHETIAQATDFEVTRIKDESVESTLEKGPHLQSIRQLAGPYTPLPMTGIVGEEPSTSTFAAAWEPTGKLLILTHASNERPLRRIRLLLAGLGGAASLLGMVFLSRVPSRN